MFDIDFAPRLVDDESQSFATSAPYITIDSQVYTFHKIEGDRLVINEVYQISPSSPMIINKCGTWGYQEGLGLTSATILQRRQDFKGHMFRAETVFHPIFATEEENGKIGGVLGDIWHEVLEKILNFTTYVKPTKDKQYGALGKVIMIMMMVVRMTSMIMMMILRRMMICKTRKGPKMERSYWSACGKRC